MALAYKGLSVGELGNISFAIRCFKSALLIDHDYDQAQISLDTAKNVTNQWLNNWYQNTSIFLCHASQKIPYALIFDVFLVFPYYQIDRYTGNTLVYVHQSKAVPNIIISCQFYLSIYWYKIHILLC